MQSVTRQPVRNLTPYIEAHSKGEPSIRMSVFTGIYTADEFRKFFPKGGRGPINIALNNELKGTVDGVMMTCVVGFASVDSRIPNLVLERRHLLSRHTFVGAKEAVQIWYVKAVLALPDIRTAFLLTTIELLDGSLASFEDLIDAEQLRDDLLGSEQRVAAPDPVVHSGASGTVINLLPPGRPEHPACDATELGWLYTPYPVRTQNRVCYMVHPRKA